MKNNKHFRIIFYIIGLFLAAMVYNLIFVPNNIVTGGVSGLAIVVKAITGLNTTIFIDSANVLLIIISFIFLGKKETLKQMLGCISYPLMITLTSPLAKVISIKFPSFLLGALIAALIYGFATGIIYRAGFSTGGFDILTQILSNKFKRPITVFSPILNISVIIAGFIALSPINIMYGIMVIFISNRITNAVLFSISNCKMVYVISSKNETIKDYIMNEIKIGATEIKINRGLFERKKQMLMCIVHNTQYNLFKLNILKMDPKATIIAKKCYEVTGGMRYNILPF